MHAGGGDYRAVPVHPHRTPCRFIRTARHAGSVHSLKSVRLLNLSHVETEVALPGTRRIREPLAQASPDLLGFYVINPVVDYLTSQWLEYGTQPAKSRSARLAIL